MSSAKTQKERVVMKNHNFGFLAIFAIALTALSVTFTAEGQNSANLVSITYPLPDRLEMVGSTTNYFNWIFSGGKDTNVTIFSGFSASWTDSSGNPGIPFTPPVEFNKFGSYQDYIDNITVYQEQLYVDLSDLTDQGAKVTYDFPVGFLYGDNAAISATALVLFGKVDHLSEMTTVGLSNLELSYTAAPLRISDLESFSVRVETSSDRFANEPDDSTVYLFTWTNSVRTVLRKTANLTVPKEFTSPYVVFFNEWYSTNSLPARFTIKAGGVTKVYTQNGDEVANSAKFQFSPKGLTVFGAESAYTVIESSEDLITWTQATAIDGFSDETEVTIPLYPGLPRLFFRTTVW